MRSVRKVHLQRRLETLKGALRVSTVQPHRAGNRGVDLHGLRRAGARAEVEGARVMTLRDELEAYAADGREACKITDEIFDGIVTALRRDRRFAAMPLQELELVLADARVDSERRLFNELRGCVHLDDVGALIDGADISD
jgi:hypothetical protein